jgi:hypothetical protein
MTRLSVLQFSHIQRVFDGKKYENIYHKLSKQQMTTFRSIQEILQSL